MNIYSRDDRLRKGWSYPESKRSNSTRSLLFLTSDWDFSDSMHSKYRKTFNKSFKLHFHECHIYDRVSENFLNKTFKLNHSTTIILFTRLQNDHKISCYSTRSCRSRVSLSSVSIGLKIKAWEKMNTVNFYTNIFWSLQINEELYFNSWNSGNLQTHFLTRISLQFYPIHRQKNAAKSLNFRGYWVSKRSSIGWILF